MKKIILSILFILFLVENVSAQNISIDYPEEIRVGEEFDFKIELVDFEDDIYDIKIDVLAGGERIAQIWNNGEWKSTYYYINDVIGENEEKEFLLKVMNYIENADIEIKIRNSKGISKSFSGYKIKVEKAEEQETSETQTLSEDEEDDEKEQEDDNEDSDNRDTESERSNPSVNIVETKKIENEIIILSSKDIKTNGDSSNQDKNKKAFYGLAIFCGLLLCLFFVQRRKKDGIE